MLTVTDYNGEEVNELRIFAANSGATISDINKEAEKTKTSDEPLYAENGPPLSIKTHPVSLSDAEHYHTLDEAYLALSTFEYPIQLDHTFGSSDNEEMILKLTLNKLKNEIAARTRRACGNVALCSEKNLELIKRTMKHPFGWDGGVLKIDNWPDDKVLLFYSNEDVQGENSIWKGPIIDGPFRFFNHEDHIKLLKHSYWQDFCVMINLSGTIPSFKNEERRETPLTVSEIIERLKEFPPEYEVITERSTSDKNSVNVKIGGKKKVLIW